MACLLPDEIRIGFEGEQYARSITFDLSSYFEKWPDSTPQLLYCRPGEVVAYTATIELDGTTATWNPDAFATGQRGGNGSAQFVFTTTEDDETVIGKSRVMRLIVHDSIGAGENPPDPYESWLEQMTEAAERAETASANATRDAETASSAATTATSASTTATSAATTASTAAITATSAATQATSAATTAGTAATQASLSASAANTSATTASNAATTATSAATTASSSAATIVDLVDDAEQYAANAAANAELAAQHVYNITVVGEAMTVTSAQYGFTMTVVGERLVVSGESGTATSAEALDYLGIE